MLDMNAVEQEIEELEKLDTCLEVCKRLAWLYIVREFHNKDDKPNKSTETITAVMTEPGSSEFISYASRADVKKLLHILDDGFTDLKTIAPSWYDKMMKEIKSIAR